MGDHNLILPRDINHIGGPNGEIVVVVKPQQDLVREVKFAKEDPVPTICAITCCILGFPFIVIGFSLTCVGLSKLSDDYLFAYGPLVVGLIFFCIGLLACIGFGCAMRVRGSDHQRRIRLYMHNPSRRPVEPEEQPIISTGITENTLTDLTQLTPYQRFMLLRGNEHRESQNFASSQIHIHDQTREVNQTPYRSSAPSLNVHGNTLPRTPEAQDVPGNAPDSATRTVNFPSNTLPSMTSRSSNPSRIRPSTSQVSLDRLLGEVTALASSLDDELDNRSRPVSSYGNSATSPMAQSHGRSSPYDNSLFL